ncbi:Uncharacterized conserved protein, DUF1015 family [Klenkia marina]|uniref:Uncharacterized conserved protein, DUF1015 family n=1 Tax=Klenkia marina TaxID=1960309 RepID=A0A1G4YL46_9ACTN|nr:DUF1015 domain-containing protein [Klenkia marina]SCX54025.1 Uncharacterized conserved protein, DUF1015 family [Klenkia marina]
MPPSSTAGDALVVHPFRALTYAAVDADHLTRVSSPAYDLVTSAGRARLAAADPHNVVRLILPGPDDAAGQAGGPCDRQSAERAAGTLQQWLDDGVLVRDREPALWCYAMVAPDGVPTVGWLGAVELPPDGSRAVLPHEDVHPGAVAGRRELLAATRTDLEPIVLAHDPSAAVERETALVLTVVPDMRVADDDGVVHELRRVTDPATLARLADGFAQVASVIADGHHRFAAARALAAGGPGRVLALLTPMGPGGLRVRAIHRVVPGLDLPTAARAAAAGFVVAPAEVPVPDGSDSWSPGPGRFVVTDGSRAVLLSEPTPSVRDRVPPDAPPSWRALDVVLAHHGLIAGCWGRPDDPASVLVAHDVDEALRLARRSSGVALLLHPSTPADVAAVARDGARMPRKSTLFVPKPRTGLVLRPH